MSLAIPVTRLPHGLDVPLPAYASLGSAGLDLRAAIEQELIVPPGTTVAVPTGIQIALPDGFEAQVRPRSGLALKHSIGVMNSPGTIDSDYRGEIKVILTNFGREPFSISRGDRIAQMVIARFEKIEWDAVDSLPVSERGEGGFGHTGK